MHIRPLESLLFLPPTPTGGLHTRQPRTAAWASVRLDLRQKGAGPGTNRVLCFGWGLGRARGSGGAPADEMGRQVGAHGTREGHQRRRALG